MVKMGFPIRKSAGDSGCSHLPAAYRSVPRPSSPVYAKASTNCPYLTLENPHHHRQTCLHYTASIYRRSGLSSDRYKTPGRTRGPARLGAVWTSQLDNPCCVLIDRVASIANHG